MPLSAAFTVNAATNPATHVAAYSSTVNLALTSLTGVNVIEWSIVACSHAAQSIPTITLGGSPLGATASFAMPATPGDTEGRSFLVKCRVLGPDSASAVEFGLVGALNGLSLIPMVPGEEATRHATHGWTAPINTTMARSGTANATQWAGQTLGASFTAPPQYAHPEYTGTEWAAQTQLNIASGANIDFKGDGLIKRQTVDRIEIDATGTEVLTPTGVNGIEVLETSFAVYLGTINVGDGSDGELVTIKATNGTTQGGTVYLQAGTGTTNGNVGLIETDFGAGAAYVIISGIDDSININHKTGSSIRFAANEVEFMRFADSGTGAIAATGTMRVRNSFTLIRRNQADTDDRTIISGSSDTLFFGEDTHGGGIVSRVSSGNTHSWNIGGVVQATLSTTIFDLDVAALSIGTSPAASGNIRVPRSGAILVCNNQAGAADITLLGIDGGNALTIGESTDLANMALSIATGGSFSFLINAASAASLSATQLQISSGIYLDFAGEIDIRRADSANHGIGSSSTGLDFKAVSGQNWFLGGNLWMGLAAGILEFTPPFRLTWEAGEIDIRRDDSTTHRIVSTSTTLELLAPNLELLSTSVGLGGGTGVISIANASTPPSTNPSGGGILYCEGGALKYRGSGGTPTTIAPA